MVQGIGRMIDRTVLNDIKASLVSTPAFILDQASMIQSFEQLAAFRNQSGCNILYSIKALPLSRVLEWAEPWVDGFSVSSLFEARLAADVAPKKPLHLTTPGLRPDQFEEISRLCSHISFNSVSQQQRLIGIAGADLSLGVRINPKVSFIDDSRYDPCRKASKLGVAIDDIIALQDLSGIQGLHFHTNFDSLSALPLLHTIDLLEERLGFCFEQLSWLNLGGGYLPESYFNNQNLIRRIKQLRSDWGIDVYIEPGKGVLANVGYLVATVIDLFESDDKQIALLDTSVNHLPEVFEYQLPPNLIEHDPLGQNKYQLTGSTCLAGDVFGDYLLSYSLQPGDRLIFADVGAYSLVKAHRFNGYNLPDLYCYNDKHKLTKLKEYSYQDYRQQWLVT